MDISEQKKAEEQLLESRNMLQASLKEKEVLMREIYHRTKNNMLVIISMLNLQAMDIDDEHVRGLFKETENRIRAMSLAHEKLYQSQNLSEVDLSVYLQDVVRTLVDTMVYGNRVVVDVDCTEGINVSLDAIVPLGLAVNEIVTNSIKHAFPNYGSGRIFVRAHEDESGTVIMQVGDDGVGLPPELDVAKSPSLGLQITVNLIEKQLQGSLEVDRTSGTMYIVRFKEAARPKRI
jgi:two-component sensor histidine kinase